VHGRPWRPLDTWVSRLSRGVAGRLARRQDGVVAVEFALLAVPFLGLILVILNSAMMIFTNAVVQGAVISAARQIRTGQMQNIDTNCPPAQNSTLSTFKTNVCNNLFGQLACGNLYFDVHTYPSFSQISLPTADVSKTCFNTGGSGAIVAVRVMYNWQNVVPGLNALFSYKAGPPAPLQYTVILKNEPF
jgi:Flp pilus assembly protein TadG